MDEQKREEYFARKEEEWQRRQDRWRITEGLAEFLAVVAGVGACLILVLLIASLVSWLRQDAAGTFSVFINMFKQ
jgi:ABC-type multidrug transport system fused ATPase/permease subunit